MQGTETCQHIDMKNKWSPEILTGVQDKLTQLPDLLEKW